MARSWHVFLMQGILLLASGLSPLAGQEVYKRPATPGAFGPRILGQPLTPRPSRFDNRLQRGPNGDFQGISDRGRAFAAPWQPIPPRWVAPEILPVVPLALSAPSPSTVGPTPEPATPGTESPSVAPLAPPSSPSTVETPPAESPAASVAVPPAAPVAPRAEVSVRPIGGLAAAPTATANTPPVLSMPLSMRLTRIAASGGVQTATGVEVYLRGNTAILRGQVATQHDRELLANLASLEPGVWRIDNQLRVAPAPTPGP